MSFVLGVDLSGPANIAETAAACFRLSGGELTFESIQLGVSDALVCEIVASLPAVSRVVIGMDAPLSYNPGGGDRPADAALRKQLVSAGMAPGSVMAPTMTRMAYLTLRGVVLARSIQLRRPRAQVVEVHPGGSMALRGAPLEAVRTFKSSARSRRSLVQWLGSRGLVGLPSREPSDHEVAAYGCALGAWQWVEGNAAWLAPAEPPHHPYDFAC